MVLIGFLISMFFFIFGWFEKSGLDFSGLDFSDQHVFAFSAKRYPLTIGPCDVFSFYKPKPPYKMKICKMNFTHESE